MLQELDAQDFDRVRPLFQGFDYSLSIQAALAGNSPCYIFVDDVQQPHVAFALTVEGYLLSADPHDAAVRASLSRFLQEVIFTQKIFVGPSWWMAMAVHPAHWENYLPALIPTHDAERVMRYHYQYSRKGMDWRTQAPEGYQVYPLSAILQGEVSAQMPDELYDEFPLETYWGTTENFIAQGVGFCAVRDEQVVALCKANCRVGEEVEVGVHTLAAHRRQGLAAAVTAATVMQSLEQGMRCVHWQCDSDNIGSIKTAEKVGFRKVGEYFYYCYIYDVEGQNAQLGWRAFRTGDYEKCVKYYERAFTRREQSEGSRVVASDYYYAAAASAAQGNKRDALRYMGQAIQMGWKDIERTLQTKWFETLFSATEWQMLLEQMSANQ